MKQDALVQLRKLVGALGAEKKRLLARLDEINRVLGSVKVRRSATPARRKPRFSAAARKRIAEAQNRRWAAYYAKQKKAK
jgi:hypothetical protein